jgi:RNA polymerase sigma factor (sigma-70 family)
MIMNTDAHLLTRFADEGDEAAFTELLDRYSDLVYSAALRQVGGDTHLACDIAQNVFAALAQKARLLPRQVVLGGWLYRHTGFVARQALRTEARRRCRERKAALMTALYENTESAWEHLTPVLDEAMERLGAGERDAIILRYFERRDLASVAGALGTSEEAAKKRLSRGLERLRVYFKRRGLAFSGAALGSLLTANAVTAAPVAWKAAVSASALASASLPLSAGGDWLVKVLTVSRLKTAVLGAVLVCGLACLLWWSLGSPSLAPVSVRVELTGTAGAKLAGYYVSDGARHAFTGMVPTNITVEARQFFYSIKKASEPGELRGDLYLDGQSRGASSTSAAGWGVAGRFRYRGGLPETMVTTASPNNEP